MNKLYSLLMIALSLIALPFETKAQTTITEEYDFTTEACPLWGNNLTLSETALEYTHANGDGTALYLGEDAYLNGRFAFTKTSVGGDEHWHVTTRGALRIGHGNYAGSKSGTTYEYSLLNLKAGDKITLTFSGTFNVNTSNLALADDNSAVAAGSELTSETTYIVTTTEATTNVDFTITRKDNYTGIKNLKIETTGDTRSIAANSFATAIMPVGAAIPAGLKAYSFSEGSETSTLVLSEVTTGYFLANTPYIIYNTTGEAIDLNYVTTSSSEEQTLTLGNVTIHGTYSEIKETSGSEYYGLPSTAAADENGELTVNKINGATIPAYRLYFTLTSGSKGINLKFAEGGTTGITSVNSSAAAAAGSVYSMAGRIVRQNASSLNGLSRGIYIVNGKKVVVSK